MVSIITAVYNGEKYIAGAIESVLRQTYNDWEYIIVDDGSEDGTEDIIKKYLADKRIIFIKQANNGCSSARNRGIETAQGELIAILDADDEFLHDKIEKQVKYMSENPDCIALGGCADYIDDCGEVIFTSKLNLNDTELKARLPESPFINSWVVFRKQIFEKYRYEEKLKYAEDGYFFNMTAKEGKWANMQDTLIKYRLLPNSKGRRDKKTGDKILELFTKLKKHTSLADEEIEYINALHLKNKDYWKKEYYSYLCYAYYHYNEKIDPHKFRHMVKQVLRENPFEPYNYLYLFLSLLPGRLSEKPLKKNRRCN